MTYHPITTNKPMAIRSKILIDYLIFQNQVFKVLEDYLIFKKVKVKQDYLIFGNDLTGGNWSTQLHLSTGWHEKLCVEPVGNRY